VELYRQKLAERRVLVGGCLCDSYGPRLAGIEYRIEREGSRSERARREREVDVPAPKKITKVVVEMKTPREDDDEDG
jgi:hypothetical protein